MKKIVGIGNALVDVIVHVENEDIFQQFSLKKGGMEMIDEEKKRKIHNQIQHLKQTIASGGSTSNTIHGLARLGVKTGYIGKVSNDKMGDFFKKDLQNSQITPHLVFSPLDTGIATTFMTPDAERTFATYLGAASELTPKDIDESILQKYNYIHVEGYLIFNADLIEQVCYLAKKNNLIISMDMGSYNVMEDYRDFMMHLLKNYVNIIFGNEEEVRALTQIDEIKGLEKLAKTCDVAVVKLGKKGSIVKMNNQVYNIPPVGGDCIDANGLGDIYASGFLYGLIHDYSPEKSGWLASHLAYVLGNTVGAKLSDEQWVTVKKEIFA